MILNEQHPRKLHETKNEQEVNKQVKRDLVIRTEYSNDKYDNSDDQIYTRHPAIG